MLQAGDSTPEELATATQVQGPYMPIVREKPSVELVKVTVEMKPVKAYDKLHDTHYERDFRSEKTVAADPEYNWKVKVKEGIVL